MTKDIIDKIHMTKNKGILPDERRKKYVVYSYTCIVLLHS